MITLTYDAPQDGDTRLEGAWTDGESSGTFSAVLIYTNGEIDLVATENQIQKAWGE